MHRDAEWHLELINAVYSQKQQEEVVTMLATAYQRTGQDRLHLSPNELGGVLALNRGVALFSAQQFSAAEQAFRQAADTFSDPSLRIMSYFALGMTQKVLDRHADAIKTYQGIQRLAEGDPKWRAFLAMALHFEAWSHHAEAEKLKGKDPAQAQRLLDTASGLYDRALALVPEYAKIRYNRSLLLTLAADLADGRGEKEAAQRLRTQAAEELANAAEALKRRLTAHADDARAHFTFAMVCVRQKALDLALTHIEEAVRLDRSLALLVPTEEVFKPLQGRKEFQAILEKGKELGREVPGRNLFFDADLPMARPSERM
jgi:tetratricopeptide (TPR) repeat protein